MKVTLNWIKEFLDKASKRGASKKEIAFHCDILDEITKGRLDIYMSELLWAGVVRLKRNGRYVLVDRSGELGE